jgi:broad specificity phosphatase PhoE
MKIFLVRHGESEGNLGGTLQGCRLDTPLTRRGRRQAEALAVRLAEAEVDDVVASPMARARETAEICAAPHGLAVRLDLELVEFDWGVWTGLPLDDEMDRSVAELRAKWRSGDLDTAPPGGESALQAGGRAARVLGRLKKAGTAAPIVVAHGRFNRILMATLLGRDLARMDEIRQRNGSISVFDWDGEGAATPVVLDDVSHLGGDVSTPTGKVDWVRA